MQVRLALAWSPAGKHHRRVLAELAGSACTIA
jgi:hypothetical protein